MQRDDARTAAGAPRPGGGGGGGGSGRQILTSAASARSAQVSDQRRADLRKVKKPVSASVPGAKCTGRGPPQAPVPGVAGFREVDGAGQRALPGAAAAPWLSCGQAPSQSHSVAPCRRSYRAVALNVTSSEEAPPERRTSRRSGGRTDRRHDSRTAARLPGE